MPKIKMVMEQNGKLIVPCRYDDIKPAIVDDKESEEIYITKKNLLFGLANIKRSITTENIYISISNFENGLAIVKKWCVSRGTKYGIINTDLYECLECDYDSITKLSNKFYLVRRNDSYGVYKVGMLRKLIVPCVCTHIEHHIETSELLVTKEQLTLDFI